MRRILAASSTMLAVLVVPAVALAKPPTPQHRALYERLYRRDAQVNGRRDPGCKLIGPRASCHQPINDGAVVRSIGVLLRALAPPPVTAPPATTPSAVGTAPASQASLTPREAAVTPSSTYSAPAASDSGGGGGYSIPSSIVMCESGGNYSAVNSSSGAGGAYQIMPSTWQAYGGSGLPQNASKAQQDAIASKIYAGGAGRGNWSC